MFSLLYILIYQLTGIAYNGCIVLGCLAGWDEELWRKKRLQGPCPDLFSSRMPMAPLTTLCPVVYSGPPTLWVFTGTPTSDAQADCLLYLRKVPGNQAIKCPATLRGSLAQEGIGGNGMEWNEQTNWEPP